MRIRNTQRQQQQQIVCLLQKNGEEEVEKDWRRKIDEDEINDFSCKRHNAAAAAEPNYAPCSPCSVPSSNHADHGGWCHKDKTVPWKKRIRGCSEINGCNEDGQPMMNIKDSGLQGKETKEVSGSTNHNSCHGRRITTMEADTGSIISSVTSSASGVGKKRGMKGGGGVIMEGSGCSRVNGRGWRCCQPTLIGYSLCEHHLGKGRLQRLTSAPSSPSLQKLVQSSSALGEVIELDDDDDEEQGDKKGDKPLMTMLMRSRKRMRLGTVKARSLTSLLRQTNKGVAVEEEEEMKD
ncbi:hypothetical protein Dimus_001887 [Dionaea muscipula]